MFDLIDECGKELKAYGYSVREAGRYGISVAQLKIDSHNKSEALGLSCGQYYIISSPLLHSLGMDNEVYLSDLLANKIKAVLKLLNVSKKDKILLACLGNFEIAGDRLGKEVFDRVDISSLQQPNRLYKFCPNIFLFTGVESADVIKMFVANIGIQCVIIIDSLTTSSLSRLGTSFQISSGGMTPGSGVNRFGKAIDKKYLNAKCISIGVPFMIKASALVNTESEVVLVAKDVSQEVANAGEVIAQAINKVFL